MINDDNYKLVAVNSKYCDYLRKFDYRVSYNSNQKERRPFVGVLFKINDIEYFAPLSSPKKKHLNMKNTLDFYKLDGGNLGAINFNNMIPVPPYEYMYIDTSIKYVNISDKKYQNLLKNQLRWLNRYGKKLRYKAKSLYNKEISNSLPKTIYDRCCNFKILEDKYKEYIIKYSNDKINLN